MTAMRGDTVVYEGKVGDVRIIVRSESEAGSTSVYYYLNGMFVAGDVVPVDRMADVRKEWNQLSPAAAVAKLANMCG